MGGDAPVKQRKRPWATWKMTIAVLVGSIVLIAIVAVIAFPGDDNHEQRTRVGHALGGAIFFLTIAAALFQWWRVRRWDEAARARDLGEPRLSSTTGSCLRDGRPLPGRFDLTPTRIVFFRASQSDGVFGQIIGLAASGRGRVATLEIQLAAIASTARTQFRGANNALDVTMTDGTVHRLVFDRYAAFEGHLVPALAHTRAAATAPT